MSKEEFNPNEHLRDLKNGKYLDVKWRLVWFRQDHPNWRISTELLEHVCGDHAVFKCIIMDPKTEEIFSEGHGSESTKDFKDYLEKAETKAVGRALAMLGYGTQFAPELEEGERICDSPVETSDTKASPDKDQKKAPEKKQEAVPNSLPVPPSICDECGNTITDAKAKNGKLFTAAEVIELSLNRFNRKLCSECMSKMSK